jgi:hypothetical protein
MFQRLAFAVQTARGTLGRRKEEAHAAGAPGIPMPQPIPRALHVFLAAYYARRTAFQERYTAEEKTRLLQPRTA